MRMLAAQAAEVLAGYNVVADFLDHDDPHYYVVGTNRSAVGIVAELTARPDVLQARMWKIGPTRAELVAHFAGAYYSSEAAV